jgi:phage-related protein
MYEIIFYHDKNGKSELLEFIKYLDKKAHTNKHERIMLKQIRLYLNILERLGTRAGNNFVKHIQDDLWEIRPGINRIFFFLWYKNRIVLLHQFRKNTRKTPKKEIIKALKEMDDWKGRNHNE